MTIENLAADIVDRIHAAPLESKLNLTLLVRDLIKNQQQEKWMKLSEQKPKDGQLCLVAAQTDDPNMPLRHISCYDPKDGFFLLVDFWNKRITHWMPYPEAPKFEAK